MQSTSPKPGEIWKVDVGLAGKVRWFIIVTRFDPDAPRALSLAVPVTTQNRNSNYEIKLGRSPCFREESFANIQALTTLQWADLQICGGRVSNALFEETRNALRFALEL